MASAKEFANLNVKYDRLKVLAFNLLRACEHDDPSAKEQTVGELRGWFDRLEQSKTE